MPGYEGNQVYIPLGREGLTYNKNPIRLPPGGLLQAEAVQFTDDSIHKRAGLAKLGGYGGISFSFTDADVNAGTDRITETAHGYLTGDGPFRISPATSATLPGGITAAQDYYVVRVDANTISLATTRAAALAGTPLVDITSAGSGTFAATSTSIFSLYDWQPNEGSQFLVTLSSNGKIYIAEAGQTQLAQNETVPSGATTPPRAIFVTAGGETSASGRMLVVFTGVGAPGFYQATGLFPTKLSLPPTDWSGGNQPLNGCIHAGRLFGWGNANAPHSIYGSSIDRHYDFVTEANATASGATYHRVLPGVGLRIYCGHSHKGLLFLLKYPRGIFYLDDGDINPLGWQSKEVTDSTGCAPTPFASILLDDGILFMSADGQFFLLTASTNGGVVLTDLSSRMNLDQWLTANLNLTRLAQVVSVWNPTTKEAHFAVPSKRNGSSSTTNDLVLTFDFKAFARDEAKVRFSYSYRDAVQAFALRRNPTTYIQEVIYSDYAGNVWTLDQAERSKNSALPGASQSLTGYTSVFQTAHTSFSEFHGEQSSVAVMNKNYDWLGIEYIPNTGGSITVEHFVDGVSQGSQTVSLKQAGPVLGSSPGETEFTIYSGSGSTTASELAGTTTSGLDLRLKWVRLTGQGRRISIQITSSGVAAEDMNITGLYIGFRPAGQDVGRTQGAQ